MQRLTRDRIPEAYRAAQKLQAGGRSEAAIAAYRAILAVEPKVAEAHFQIARILATRGSFTDARAAAEAALRLRPREEAIWAVLADIARADEAAIVPRAVLTRARKAGLAADALERISERLKVAPPGTDEPTVPAEAEAILRRSSEAARRGDDAKAKRLIDKALAVAPGSPPLLIRRSELEMTLGDLEAARRDVLAAIEAAPDVGGYWRVWSRADKIRADDPLLAELDRRYSAAPEGSENRRQMGFALAKAMEDIGAHDRVFGYLNEANALTARIYPYSHQTDAEDAGRFRRAYTKELAARWAGKGATDAAPIFVTGMPRSGTTLVEQILASHSQVAGGGEMALLFKPLDAVVKAVMADGIEAGAGFAKVGRDYAAELAKRFPGAARVTDKSITTYVAAGFVPLALPKAKIVVVRRDPRDSCLSVLKTRFADGRHRYSYSMEATAAFYKLFAAQVAFWREAAPGAFVEIHYEDLVADLEGAARKLLAACDLPWEDGVLAFHENTREVKTLSMTQVRQPLYSSSVGAWKRYKTDLAPLIAALGPVEKLT